MSSLVQSCLLLAERSRLSDVVGNLGTGFREHRSRVSAEELLVGLLLIVGGILSVGFMLHFGYRGWRRFRNSPTWLFCRLAAANGLSWADRLLLWRLARHQKLADMSVLFVEPQCFSAGGLPPGLQAAAGRLQRIHDLLFAPPSAMVQVFSGPPPAVQVGTADTPGTAAMSHPAVAHPVPLPPTTPVPQVESLDWTGAQAGLWSASSETLNPVP